MTGVSTTVIPSADAVARLVADAVASRTAAGERRPGGVDPGWVDAARGARPLVGEISALRERLRVAGLGRVVLAGTGGTGVAAEVLAGPGARLTVLDGTDPVQVAEALAGDLESTVLVVSAPDGAPTAGLELVWDTVAGAMRADGLDPADQTVLVATPDSPLIARADGAVVVLGPARVTGPWTALTAFALVPAGLAGADVEAVLADAADTRALLGTDEASDPAVTLGALLADTPVVALDGREPLAEWVAGLLAAGLGRALLPVVVESPGAPGWAERTIAFDDGGGDDSGADIVTAGSPAAQMLLWQHAVAAAAHLTGDTPAPPESGSPTATADRPTFTDGMVEVFGDWLPPGTATVADALRALLAAGEAHPGVAVHAYLDRHDDASAALLRPELTRRTGRITAFGWAERALATATAVCQVTGSDGDGDGSDDPGGDPFSAFQQASARADAAALTRDGATVLRLHLTDRVVGLVTLVRAVQEL
ncbi:glucose-6-phosphate isomerase [Pseudonocardia sp. GCM10023141]|uniref:glucose-6-phosphate isomerase n=1 Tax=Pseudonocardia sp. GCM10023141 TaxID=3252653 RepID=UPI00360C85AE